MVVKMKERDSTKVYLTRLTMSHVPGKGPKHNYHVYILEKSFDVAKFLRGKITLHILLPGKNDLANFHS